MGDRAGGEVRVERDGPTPRFENGQTQARFTFSGEPHFDGLDQGGLQPDRLEVARQLWKRHLGHGADRPSAWVETGCGRR